MKIGLVLEGGAMRGMYTAGVLDVFLDHDIIVNDIVGVSAGALFGVNYVSKQKGRTIRYNKRYINDKRFISLSSLIKTGNIVNEEFAYHELPEKLDVFDQEAFEKSNINFYATVTNVSTGMPEYIKINNAFEQIEVLRASSSMPFVSKMVEIDNNLYLDGGISDSIPIDKCLQLGCDKIIVILTRPLDYRKTKKNNGIIKKFYKDYPNLINTMSIRYKNYNDTIDQIINLEKEGKIFVFRPSKKIKIKRLEKSREKLQEMYDLGIKDCLNNMIRLNNYLSK